MFQKKGKRTTIKLLSISDDGGIAKIKFIDDRDYKLQHPGNRTKLEWEQDMFQPGKGFDRVSFLEKCFENIIIPDGHDFQPNIDNVNAKELEVWERVLSQFLEGDLGIPVEQESAKSGKGTGVN